MLRRRPAIRHITNRRILKGRIVRRSIQHSRLCPTKTRILINSRTTRTTPIITIIIQMSSHHSQRTLASILLRRLPQHPHHFKHSRRIVNSPTNLTTSRNSLNRVRTTRLMSTQHSLVRPVILIRLNSTVRQKIRAIRLLILISRIRNIRIPNRITHHNRSLTVLRQYSRTSLILIRIAHIQRQRHTSLLIRSLLNIFQQQLTLQVRILRLHIHNISHR